MRKFIHFLALAVLLTVPSLARSQSTLTIGDGTATNAYVPVYGYYADAYLKSQFVYPATDIANAVSTVNMNGGTITGLTFYASESSVSLTSTFTVKMMEISTTTLSAFQDVSNATTVYTGTVAINNNQMVITFTTPYTYNGGNLLIEFATASTGNWETTTFLGVDQSGASVQGYSYSGVSSVSPTARNFMPKTTFTFTGGAAVSCPAVQGYSVSGITSSGATLHIVDSLNSGASYSINYWKPNGDTTNVIITDTTYTFSNLDANSLYYYNITVLCSSTDESVALGGSFATLCGGSTCNMYLTAGYGGTFQLYQNGDLKGTYVPYNDGTTSTATVCSTDPVVIVVSTSVSYYALNYSVTDMVGTTVMSGSLTYGQTAIDTIANPCPTCIPPAALHVDSVDQNNITIAWTPRSGATLFAVYLNDSLISDNVTDTFYTFSGLSANVQYALGVKAICSTDDTSHMASLNSRTACGEITLPYFVDFEDAAYNGAWYPCWDSTIHAGTDPSVNDQNSPANHTDGGMYAMYLQSNSSENYNLVVSPAIPLLGDQIFVSFWARCNSNAWMKAGVMTNPRDTSTFIPLVDISGDSWSEYTMTTAGLDPSATYYVAWLGYRNSGFIGKFDDILIREDLGCNKPTLAVVENVGPYSADLRWSNGGDAASSYDVFYNTSNNLGTAMVESGINDTTFTLTNLLPQTTYYAWVRTTCGSDSSEFKAFSSFTTQLTCAPVVDITMGNISYTAAQISWDYDTLQGFPSEGVHIILTDNTDTTATPDEIDVTGNSYTFTNLLPGHAYTAVLRNMCTAPNQTDTAANVPVSFMTTSCAEIASDGSTNNYIPTYTWYGNTYSQMLYLASEMPNIDSIHGIAFNITNRNTGSYEARTLDIYVRNLDTNAFNGNNYFPVDSTMLYASSVVLHSSQTGWQVIPFDSAFVYNGTSNLLITVNDRTNNYGSAASYASISAPNRGKYSYRDNTPWNPSEMADGNNINNIPAVRFVADCEVPQCFAPMLSLDSVDGNNIIVHWVSTGTESSWVVGFKAYGDNDYTYENSPITDTFFTFTNLSSSTLYDIVVGSLCDDGDTMFATLQAITPCAGATCAVTVDMTDGYGDGWNGNAVEAYQNGAFVGSTTVSSGYSAIDTISVCSGIPVDFRLHVGSYPDEISFTILDGGGDELYTVAEGTFSTSTTNGILLASTPNACPSCVRAAGFMATAVDSTSISVSWNALDTVFGYLIAIDNETATFTTSGSETFYNLDANSEHTIRVWTLCTTDDTSSAASLTLRTTCGVMTLPFVESFENDSAGDIPQCWSVIHGDPEIDGYSNSHTGTNSLMMDGTDMIATSLVPLAGDSLHVGFWAKHSGGTLEVGVMTNPLFDSTFIPMVTSNGNGDVYTHYEFNTLTLPHDSSYYVAFRYNAAFNYIYIDDINIRVDDGCMTPSNLTANVSAGSTSLSWHNSSTANNFLVEYREVGGSWSTPDATNDTTYTLTGLNATTSYEVRVGLICGGDTLWTSTSFQTPCGLLPLPYFEDFDAYANDVMPPCWGWSSVTLTHWDGGCFFRSYHGGGSEYAVVPQLDGNITKLKIEFDAKVGTIAEGDGILIGVADASGTLVAWLDTIQDVNYSRNAHVRKTVYFTDYIMPPGAARVAFAQYKNWSEWALIDNINIEELPDCYPIRDLTGHNLIDPENITFSWTPQGTATQWQVYVDTVTVGLDSVENMPVSNFTTVYDTFYTIPMSDIQGGGVYNIFVRSNCIGGESSWEMVEFGAGTVIMANNTVADTVVGCGFVVYDNGGPIAGYVANSNSTLVIRTANAGSQLEVFGAKFGFGSTGASLVVYDGEGTTGTALYTYNTTDGRDTLLGTILATSTTGSLTIQFTSSGNMCHTGYEVYVRCTGEADCPRPTELQGTMTDTSTATVTWSGTAPSYNFYYRLGGTTVWTRQTVNSNSITLTGLTADTVYDMYVVALCTATDSSTASLVRQLNTHFGDPVTPCPAPYGLTVSNVTFNSAVIGWTAGGTETAWKLEVNGNVVNNVNTNPYTLTNLTPATQYTVKVQAVCSYGTESNWSNGMVFQTLQEDTTTVYYTITATSSNPAMGSVTGGGTYEAGTSVTLRATANPGFHFVDWNDGVTDSVRTITVTGDMSFTANFARNTGIDDVDGEAITLFPNPTSTLVTLTGVKSGSMVTVVDMNGREVYTNAIKQSSITIDVSTLAKGAYFVRITGEQCNVIRKLIVR